MCGIAGIAYASGQLMDASGTLSHLRHRGPDGSGETTISFGSRMCGLGILDSPSRISQRLARNP